MDGCYLEIKFPKLTDEQKQAAAEALNCEIDELDGWNIEETDRSEVDALNEAKVPFLAHWGMSDEDGPGAEINDGKHCVQVDMNTDEHASARILVEFDPNTGKLNTNELKRAKMFSAMMKKMGLKF